MIKLNSKETKELKTAVIGKVYIVIFQYDADALQGAEDASIFSTREKAINYLKEVQKNLEKENEGISFELDVNAGTLKSGPGMFYIVEKEIIE